MEDIILIGGGGHCKSVIESISKSNNYNIIGILDLPDKVGEEILGIKIIGTDDQLEYYYKSGVKYAFLTVGSIGNVSLRRRLYTAALNIGYNFPSIIDNTAIISDSVKIGCGSFVGKGVIINSDSTIGNNCIINSGAIIEHDCYIGDFCHIAPGSVLSGSVIVGENSHIGTNSTVIQNVRIGENTLIGAGSVVIRDIGNNRKAFGNPCREVQYE